MVVVAIVFVRIRMPIHAFLSRIIKKQEMSRLHGRHFVVPLLRGFHKSIAEVADVLGFGEGFDCIIDAASTFVAV